MQMNIYLCQPIQLRLGHFMLFFGNFVLPVWVILEIGSYATVTRKFSGTCKYVDGGTHIIGETIIGVVVIIVVVCLNKATDSVGGGFGATGVALIVCRAGG